ncbi:MAG: glycosyltransferase [Candidatus Bathyarchaeia archaeon]
MSTMRYPFVSVIVCTLNRKEFLRRCLNELLNVNYPESQYKIIVVDGGSVDGTENMVKNEFPSVKYVVEKRSGVSYARNKGLEIARGEVIAFTDDDCIVTKDWLYNLVISFDSPEIGAVGGPVRFTRKIPRKLLVKAALGGYDLGERRQFVGYLVTSNIAVKRKVFRKIRFDENLGRKGDMLFDNEDIDFCERILRMGYKLVYNPKAIVYHNINPERIKVKYILVRAFYSGKSLYLMKRKYARSSVHLFRDIVRSTIGAALLFLFNINLENFYFLIRNFSMCLAFINLI